MKETPMILDLEPGTYDWCSYGKSRNIPFCDGSHTGTEFIPVEFKITERKGAALCSCQITKKHLSAMAHIRTPNKGELS